MQAEIGADTLMISASACSLNWSTQLFGQSPLETYLRKLGEEAVIMTIPKHPFLFIALAIIAI